MLRLHLSVDRARAPEVTAALGEIGGLRRLTASEAADSADEVVLAADVVSSLADQIVSEIERLGVRPEDYLLTRQDAIAPTSLAHPAEDTDQFAWIEVLDQARANARPLARYLTLMAIAGVIAGLGVIDSNAILIVGAMAVSPDLLPVCATCVGLVTRRYPLARRAGLTLLIGFLLVTTTAALLTVVLRGLDVIEGDYGLGEDGIGGLANVYYVTLLAPLAAGIAGMLSFETRASAAVGVAISVTTIPAAAYLGVAAGAGEFGDASGAVAVLGVNIALLIVSGCATLVVQRRFAGAREGHSSKGR